MEKRKWIETLIAGMMLGFMLTLLLIGFLKSINL